MTATIADRLGTPGTDITRFNLVVQETPSGSLGVTHTARDGPRLDSSSSIGEVVIGIDWTAVDGGSVSTGAVATAINSVLLDATWWSWLGLSVPLAEMPIHLIGHSRGGSLVAGLAQRLGTSGIWVDHMTTLDPHPILVDSLARVYENVIFADNYYQTDAFVTGQAVNGTHPRRLTELGEGYDNEHSDVHLWYQGTIDTEGSAWEGAVELSPGMRESWYQSGESLGQTGGFFFSRLGGGNRVSGAPSGLRPSFGGTATVRHGITESGPQWPNAADLRMLPGQYSVSVGQTVTSQFRFNDGDSSATLTLYLDTDVNPYNGHAGLAAGSVQLGGGTFTNVSASWSTGGIAAGTYWLFAEMSDGSRKRFAYAPRQITFTATDDHANAGQWGSASTISISSSSGNGSRNGIVEVGADTDLFRFVAAGTGSATITLDPANSLDGILRVFTGGQVLLVERDVGWAGANEVVTVPVSAGQTYYLLVDVYNNASVGTYTLSVDGPPAVILDDHPNAGQWLSASSVTINAGTGDGSRNGVIEVGTDTDLFRFVAAGTGSATITLDPSNTLDVILRMYNSSQTLLVGRDHGFAGGNEVAVWSLTSGETYYLVVDVYNNASAGTYTLSVNGPPVVIPDDHANIGQWTSASPIAISPSSGDGSRNGVIEVGSDTDLFRFVAAGSGTATVTLDPSSSLDVILSVYSSNQTFLLGRDAGWAGGNEVAVFSVTAGQTYYLLADVYNNASVGTYTLSVNGPVVIHDDHPNAGQWTSASMISISSSSGDGSRNGVIEVGTDTDLFRFVAAGSGAATITLDPASSLDVIFRVYNSNQALLVERDSQWAGGNEVAVLSLTAGQTYYVLVDVYNNGSTGAYTVTIEGPPSDDHVNAGQWFSASTISISSSSGGGSRNGVIEVGADTDLFRFVAAGSGAATITLDPASSLDVILRVYNSSRTLLAERDSQWAGGNEVAGLSVTAGQAYYVLVDVYNNGSTGPTRSRLTVRIGSCRPEADRVQC